jgi:transcriptional/translational regulatory protein YebC/TACO1
VRLQLLCDPEEMWTVKKAVEQLAYSVSEARHEYIPNMYAYLTADQLDLAAKFLDKIESSCDVIKVYTNIKDEAEEQQAQTQ